MPGWPRTSEEGVAYVIQLHGIDSDHARKLWDDVCTVLLHCLNSY